MESPKSRNERRQAQGFVRRGLRQFFGDPLGRILPDPRHSFEEDRLVLLGNSESGRLLAVMYVERGKKIRIISARRATPRERKNYEEST